MQQFQLRNKEISLAIKYVSPGKTFTPRTITTQWLIKPRKADGELSLPFDLAMHPPCTENKPLDSNFSNYIDCDFISFSKPGNYSINRNLNAHCGYEKGQEIAGNNFFSSSSAYNRGIDNFSDRTIVMVPIFLI